MSDWDSLSEEDKNKEKEIYSDQAKSTNKPDAIIEKVLNRIDLQTSDFVSRILEQTKSKSHVIRLREIREIINSKYMYNR